MSDAGLAERKLALKISVRNNHESPTVFASLEVVLLLRFAHEAQKVNAVRSNDGAALIAGLGDRLHIMRVLGLPPRSEVLLDNRRARIFIVKEARPTVLVLTQNEWFRTHGMPQSFRELERKSFQDLGI
jgi:hypothetical protein